MFQLSDDTIRQLTEGLAEISTGLGGVYEGRRARDRAEQLRKLLPDFDHPPEYESPEPFCEATGPMPVDDVCPDGVACSDTRCLAERERRAKRPHTCVRARGGWQIRDAEGTLVATAHFGTTAAQIVNALNLPPGHSAAAVARA